MVSKKNLLLQVEEANQRAQRIARDNDAFRARETARMRSDHAEQQAKRRQADRDAKRKRIETIDGGAIPFHYVTFATFTQSNEGIELKVNIDGPTDEIRALRQAIHAAEKAKFAPGGYFPGHVDQFIYDRSRRIWEETSERLRKGWY